MHSVGCSVMKKRNQSKFEHKSFRFYLRKGLYKSLVIKKTFVLDDFRINGSGSMTASTTSVPHRNISKGK